VNELKFQDPEKVFVIGGCRPESGEFDSVRGNFFNTGDYQPMKYIRVKQTNDQEALIDCKNHCP
jgi:hypothetical protein